MAAVASLEDLQVVEKGLEAIRKTYPEGYKAMRLLIQASRQVGYRNICKMIMGATAEDLKK